MKWIFCLWYIFSTAGRSIFPFAWRNGNGNPAPSCRAWGQNASRRCRLVSEPVQSHRGSPQLYWWGECTGVSRIYDTWLYQQWPLYPKPRKCGESFREEVSPSNQQLTLSQKRHDLIWQAMHGSNYSLWRQQLERIEDGSNSKRCLSRERDTWKPS